MNATHSTPLYCFCFRLVEQLHLTDEFSNTEWREGDFPGLFPQAHRKPNTPRRQRSRHSVSEDSPDKNKQKGRRRTKSQSDDVPIRVKSGKLSPVRTHASNSSTYVADTQQSIPMDASPDASKSIETSPVIAKQKSIKMEISSPDRINKESKVVRNITDVINNEEQVKKKIKRKKRVAKIESDSDEEQDNKMEIDIKKTSLEEQEEVIMEECEKFTNEVEVKNAVYSDHSGSCDNSNAEEIFIPPVASRGSSIKIEKEKPPSDIFLKELRKFCREAIRSGALSLAELKEVLSLRQQGLF